MFFRVLYRYRFSGLGFRWFSVVFCDLSFYKKNGKIGIFVGRIVKGYCISCVVCLIFRWSKVIWWFEEGARVIVRVVRVGLEEEFYCW